MVEIPITVFPQAGLSALSIWACIGPLGRTLDFLLQRPRKLAYRRLLAITPAAAKQRQDRLPTIFEPRGVS